MSPFNVNDYIVNGHEFVKATMDMFNDLSEYKVAYVVTNKCHDLDNLVRKLKGVAYPVWAYVKNLRSLGYEIRDYESYMHDGYGKKLLFRSQMYHRDGSIYTNPEYQFYYMTQRN